MVLCVNARPLCLVLSFVLAGFPFLAWDSREMLSGTQEVLG